MPAESVTFSYNGDNEVVAVIDGAQLGETYSMICFDPNSNAVEEVATIDPFELTVSDVGGLSALETFLVHVRHGPAFNVASDYVGGIVLQQGNEDTRYDDGPPITWAFDGASIITATFVGALGVEYSLYVTGVPVGFAFEAGVTGTGALMTLTADLSPFTWEGDYLDARVVVDPADAYDIRLFTEGVPGEGFTSAFEGGGTPVDPDRFYEAPPWRLVVTNLQSETLTFLDHLASDRTVTLMRAAASEISGEVPADNPEVNIGGDGDPLGPFLDEGNRFIYAFRREGGSPPWKIRAAGIVLELDDAADGSSTRSRFTAYDPWKYLYRRPLLAPGTVEDLPPEDGITYLLTRGSDMLLDQLAICEAVQGNMYVDWGQTAFYTGTIENTAVIEEMNFARGSSLGEMLDALVETGTLDVWFEPIYDPVNRPGIIAQLSIYVTRGSYKPAAVFGWDLFPKNVVALTKLTDGSQRMNRVQYYAGQGGPPTVEDQDAASLAKFGVYFEQRFWPGQTSIAAVQTMSEQALALLKNGQLTYTLFPTAERAPVPLTEYQVGDTIPVYGTNRLREQINDLLRIEGIPIVIGNDELERINGLLVSVEGATT